MKDEEIYYCPECGGELHEGWDTYLYCENDDSHQYFVDDNGKLTTDADYDEWM